MSKVALIDGDLIAYACAASNQVDYDFTDGDEAPARAVDHDAAICKGLAMVDQWRALSQCSRTMVLFTGKNNFRKAVLPTYKAGRGEKPIAHQAVVEAIMREHPSERIDGLEADDLLGILATTLPKYRGAVVVSLDKDLATVPGNHFNPAKDKKARVVTEAEANHAWMRQTLIGDSVDGYSGLYRCGPKNADRILGRPGSSLDSLWHHVVTAYRGKGKTEEDAVVQARMARILRREDYNRETKEIRLWHPTETIWVSLTCAENNQASALSGQTLSQP